MIPVIKIAYGIPNGKKTITEYLVTFSLQIIEANIDNIAESFFMEVRSEAETVPQ